ncbi:histidinol-phosphate transaminase [Marinilabilia salmonicolor]|jgi:histidinol-phosphate aminotransferase|uniref:Histidinol-phosphate aminotransferase n=1 Tax=Marinilabilia salmonicolor TaxID=989 RepID=A0A2T0XT28_9BACT|nr:histidinol-phosphate transaminase [Marinilabilia salmonicolor]PRZ02105.1 histidinol-phosphate aminotransferase [Marinilabilia salmonicolor]RCW36060.1 histidinol-phosphate aminotransferase [Marinilabilia salmonicolor]
MNSINELLRPNIRDLKPYSSARDEFSGEAAVFLDANENPFNAPFNRYPDPYQRELKKRIAAIKEISAENIFLGNGSDEAIDIAIRAFCEPGKDNIVSISPTYGMYQVAADINNIDVKKVLLTPDFELDAEALLKAADEHTKIIFLCSPNNPTGNCFSPQEVKKILDEFNGIVVLDEAYIDFAPDKSWLTRLTQYPNLIILQTFSKAWGMAGIRLGMAFAKDEIINVFSKIKYPYNVNILTQQKALELLSDNDTMKRWVKELLEERTRLIETLKTKDFVKKVYPTDANFVLIKTPEPKKIYNYLVARKIIVRDRSNVALCEGCLRITVGTPEENRELIEALDGLS